MNNILENFNKEMCCGCSACKNICPKNAIEMKYDDQGFLYPNIDYDKCVNCGLCVKVCDFKKFKPNTEAKIDAYALKHKDHEEVNTSRSGAFFMALANYFLDKKGYIFGCEMKDQYNIVHSYYTDKNGVNKFKGSKYVQSDLLETFKECYELLLKDEYVLFSGTGCQIHGLISFLKEKKCSFEKLITCDMVCHGTPSPKIWQEFIKTYEKINKNSVVSVDFRNKKEFGWSDHKETYYLESGLVKHEEKWSKMFNESILFRPSCFSCKYTTPYRKSDFTIADCWGIEKVAPEFNDEKGVSLVLVNSYKAKEIFDIIKDNLNYKKIVVEDVLQPQLVGPTKKGKNYNKFWKDYAKNSKKCIKKYFFPSKFVLILNKIKNKIKRIIKRFI